MQWHTAVVWAAAVVSCSVITMLHVHLFFCMGISVNIAASHSMQNLASALDLHNLMICAEAIALAALERKASIGAHSRDDYPDKEEPNTKKYNTIVRKGANGEMQILREEIPEVRADLQEIIEEIG